MVSMFNRSLIAAARILSVLALLLIAGCGSLEERAQGHYDRAMKFLSQQEYAKAEIEFKNALQRKKDFVAAWRGLLEVETRKRNIATWAPILRTIVELDPKDVDAKLRLGSLLLAGNALDQALDLANAAIELDGQNARALAFRGAVLLKLNDAIGAKREAQAALEIDPANVEALIVLAAERMVGGDFQGALRVLERQGAAFENSYAIQLFKFGLFEKAGQLVQAHDVLRRLTVLYPQERAFRTQLISFYLNQKRLGDAENELRALAAENPSDIELGLNVVRFLNQFKGADAARQELLSRINAGGEVFRYQIALAEFDFAQGNATDSIQLLESLIKNARSRDDALAAQNKLAQVQFSRKNFDAAEALVSEILRKDSNNIDGLRIRASIHLERKRFEAAIADLRQALNGQPRSTELMLLLALAYERSGSIELAERQYADATTSSGFSPTAGLPYVEFLRRRGGIERAEGLLTEMATRAPSNIAVLSTLADVMLTRQNWIGAQEIAEKIRRMGEEGILPDRILSAALSGRSQYDESIRILENVYSATPNAIQPMVALVSTMVRAQRLDRAVNFLQSVLQANSENAEAYALLGAVQILQKAPDQAVKSFQTAIERQPTNIVGYQALAEFYVRADKLDEAEKIIRAGLKEQPNSASAQLTLANVLELKGDYEGAIAEYESMLQIQPASLVIANNLASLLADHRTDSDSLERAHALAIMLRRSPVPSFKDTLGWVLYRRGEHNRAVPLLEEAAAALPDRALVRYHLGMAYIATGQLAKASEQLNKARELAPKNAELQEKIKAAQEKAAI